MRKFILILTAFLIFIPSFDYKLQALSLIPDNMEKVLENDNLAFYIEKDRDLFALVNKKNNFIWYSSPINADSKNSTDSVKAELKSSLVVSCYNEKTNISDTLKSSENAVMSFINEDNRIKIIYNFSEKGFEIPVYYSLEDDFLEVTINSDEISENSDSIITEISVINSFGAGSPKENGYFIIPDGSGAVINFNNGKIDCESYSSIVYGEDLTNFHEDTDGQIYFPLYSIIKDNKNAVLSLAGDGDENMKINASVNGQNGTEYNKCFFSFIMRSSEKYFIGNEKVPITVYEENISNDRINIKYFILNGNNISYCSVAERYRNYLGLKAKDLNDTSDIYIDFYGGTLKKQSFLGIPLYQPFCVTSFEYAENFLKDTGIDNITVSYRNFSDDAINKKIQTDIIPSDILGNYKNFENPFFPVIENIEFISGNGFNKSSAACVSVSGIYSKVTSYDYVSGQQDKFRKKYYIISPNSLPEIYKKISENCNGKSISLGKSLSVLYGDYGKRNCSRGNMKDNIINSLENMDCSILAECPNAYALPYVDCITDIPLESSHYDIFDYDIPFFQMIIHGTVAYSSTAVNSFSNPDKDVLKAVALGCALNYDITGTDIHNLKDTEGDIYFYSKYNRINSDYENTKEILKSVKNGFITGYTQNKDGFLIEYSIGISIQYDMKKHLILSD